MRDGFTYSFKDKEKRDKFYDRAKDELENVDTIAKAKAPKSADLPFPYHVVLETDDMDELDEEMVNRHMPIPSMTEGEIGIADIEGLLVQGNKLEKKQKLDDTV